MTCSRSVCSRSLDIFADGPRENYIGKLVRSFCQRHGVIVLIKLNGARLGKKTPRKLKKFQLGNGGQKTNLQWSHVKLKSNGGSTSISRGKKPNVLLR